jgi:hypothetical protein
MHPTYTFRVNLSLLGNEAFGPTTNSQNVGMLSPDQHQSSPDNGRVENSNRKYTLSTWLPDLLRNNYKLKHGDTFEVSGMRALYIRNTYAVGYAPADRAFLELV